MLSGVLNLLCFETASANITIDGETVHVETDAYTVQFDRGVITHIHNKHTDETYTLSSGAGKQAWSGLLNHRYFWHNANISIRAAELISARTIDPLNAELVYRQGGTDIRLFIAVDPITDDVGLKPRGYYLARERAVYWDGRNEDGEPVSSGVYFYTLNADDYAETRRMVIVK